MAALFVSAVTACSGAPATTSAAATLESTSKPATLDLAFAKPAIAGSAVQAAAGGLPAGKTVDLRWGTVTGGWVIEDYYHFRGKKYSETTSSLGRFPVDSSGRLYASFTIPEDYGGVHEVTRARDEERTRAFEALGILVVRFTNEEVLDDLANTLERIRSHLPTRESLSLLPKSGEGRGSGEG